MPPGADPARLEDEAASDSATERCHPVDSVLTGLLIPLKTALPKGKSQTSAISQGSPDHMSTTRSADRPGPPARASPSVPGRVASTVIDTEELRFDSRSAPDPSEERVSTGLSTPLSTRRLLSHPRRRQPRRARRPRGGAVQRRRPISVALLPGTAGGRAPAPLPGKDRVVVVAGLVDGSRPAGLDSDV